jgi:tetratricopeptide (TPR) repeat protein
MNASLSLLRLAKLGAVLFIVSARAVSHAEPFVPNSDDQVLERLRAVPFDPVARELRELRAGLSAEPDNFVLAAQLARRCIERSRVEGDPRYLGHAQAALARWWNLEPPPPEALVLRATIEQSQHQFTNALADLDCAVRVAPGNAQAWLTRATILTVLGRFDEARRSCVQLIRLAPDLVAMTAAANLASVSGGADRSCALLRAALQRNPSANPAERLWALTVLAETFARLGRNAEAEEFFRRALVAGNRDAYLLGAFSDFLLDQDRGREVVTLLKDETRVDALLLRLALAEAAQGPPPSTLTLHVAALQARFEASHLRGESVHQREESRFTLHLLHRPKEALRLAELNWQVQREPADCRVLLEAALAAHNAPAASPVLEFMKTNKLEDVHLQRLATDFNTLASR